MDWQLFMQHIISGYLPLIPALLIYFVIVKIIGKKRTIAHVVLSFVFCFYLIGMLGMTGIWWIRPFSPKFVWTPFSSMVKGPVETALNVLLFIPLGFFLPLLYEQFDKAGKVALAGFLLSVSIEIIQMFGCGATDVNDLMTNTFGSCAGFFIFMLLRGLIPQTWRKAIRISGVQGYCELAVYWVLSLLAMTTIQLSIFHMLF